MAPDPFDDPFFKNAHKELAGVAKQNRGLLGRLAGLGCLVNLIGLAIAAAICGGCFNYTLMMWASKDIPWYFDALAGLVTSPVLVPVTILTWIADMCGAVTPYINYFTS